MYLVITHANMITLGNCQTMLSSFNPAKLLDPAPAAEVLQKGAHARALAPSQDDSPKLSVCCAMIHRFLRRDPAV